jgi:hypothetical protein
MSGPQRDIVCLGDEWKELRPNPDERDGFPTPTWELEVSAWHKSTGTILLRKSKREWIESDTAVERGDWL